MFLREIEATAAVACDTRGTGLSSSLLFDAKCAQELIRGRRNVCRQQCMGRPLGQHILPMVVLVVVTIGLAAASS
jgi:hypothetical protein